MIHGSPASTVPASADENSNSFLPVSTWVVISGSLRLSGRESEIAQCILAGCSKEGMAKKLGISDHTVQTHLERLYRKLGVSSRCEVVVRLFATYVSLQRELSG